MASRPWVPAEADRALAAALGPDAAFLAWEGRYFHVRSEVSPGRRPVLDLAQGIWERFPAMARAALRCRMRTTEAPTPLDRDIVDVVAKRVSWVAGDAGITPDSHDMTLDAARARARGSEALLDLGRVTVPRDVVRWVRTLVPPGAPGALAVRDRPVVAVLVDAEGVVRCAARNAAGNNRTLHAEINLVQAFGRIPASWQVLTSLQCCRMCAAVLVAAAEGPVAVRYLAADPGRLATRTALQALGWESELS